MPSWFTGLAPIVVTYVAPAEVTLDPRVDELRLVDETGDGAAVMDAVGGVFGETGRFTVADDGKATVVMQGLEVRTRGRQTEVAATFRLTEYGEVVDEVTLTAPDPRALGVAYGRRISPHLDSAERTIYTRGSPGLREGAARAAAGDWDAAVATWREVVASSEDRRDVARARHDLAVAAESADRLDRALQLARNAEPELGSATSGFVLALEERWADQKALRLQVPELVDRTAERSDGMFRGDHRTPGW